MIDQPSVFPNVPIRKDALARLMTRVHDPRRGELKVSLPTVRVWLTPGASRRAPATVLYEVLQGGLWLPVELQAVPREAWLSVGEYVATVGLSADPRVERIEFHAAGGGMKVTWKEGCRPWFG